jgi:peptidoglycan/LPS O-acetylase OafA/YrhL
VTSTPLVARRRLNGLDGLRFVAAAAVVGYHYTGVSTTYWGTAPSTVFPGLNHLTRYGYLGVELFFVVSGFVILMTAYGRPIERFTASRVARLFPAYWAAVILTVGLHLAWTGGIQTSSLESLVNLTMAQGAFEIPDVQGAFWTLWIELKFYLLIGVFILIGITRRRVIAFAVLWPLVGVIAAGAQADLAISLLFPTYAPYFGVGMLLFLLHRDGHSTIVWLGIAFTGILCIRSAMNGAAAATKLVGQPISPAAAGLVVVVMIAAVYLVTAGPGSRIGWRWLTTLGLLTYPLYLVHGQFGFFVIDVLHGRVNAYVVLVLAVALAVVLAVGLHYGIERVFHDRLRDSVVRGLRDSDAIPAEAPAHAGPPPLPAQVTRPPVDDARLEPAGR